MLYVCEVAIHLVTSLQYVKDKRPDNVGRFLAKFAKDVEWARKYFDGYTHCFMLWSPIVKDQPNAQYNQMAHVAEVRDTLKTTHQIDLELVINDRFANCLAELRKFARNESKEMKSPMMRLMQIEETLKRQQARAERLTKDA